MQHLAVIIDGNGRWAEKQGKERKFGHEKGALAVISAIEAFVELPIEYITFYAFSTENEKRSQDEIANILGVIAYFLKNAVTPLVDKYNLKVRFIGDIIRLPKPLLSAIYELNAKALNNSGKTLVFAILYGGINEVCRAFDKIYANRLFLNDSAPITEEELFCSLDTDNIPLPDAVVRYGGYKRLSNFMLLQVAYSELFFLDKFWPDFEKNDFVKLLNEYDKIKRNFGGVN